MSRSAEKIGEAREEKGEGKKGEGVMFRPPIVRSGANALNRALFSKNIKLAAAAVNDNRLISKYRKALSDSKEILLADRLSPIVSHPDQSLAAQGRKCLLLNPNVSAQGKEAKLKTRCF